MPEFECIVVPSSVDAEVSFQQKGALFVERTIGVSIRLDKVDATALGRFMRLEMEETESAKEDILRIAVESFTYDRRFNLTPECNPEHRRQILAKWIEALGPTLIAKFKGVVVGFLNLRRVDEMTYEVFLAAVDEKYRLTGAAMGLYAKAVLMAKECNARLLIGRISSRNTAVMNIYANFGAQFSEPEDVFLMEKE